MKIGYVINREFYSAYDHLSIAVFINKLRPMNGCTENAMLRKKDSQQFYSGSLGRVSLKGYSGIAEEAIS